VINQIPITTNPLWPKYYMNSQLLAVTNNVRRVALYAGDSLPSLLIH
jgi:hypothetical protein